MCTLTVFQRQGETIVTMNRDEADTREEAGEFLQENADPGQRYWWPVDAVSHGTWFGVRGDGLVLALLNRYQGRGNAPRRSRGVIIPELLRTLAWSETDNDDTGRSLPCRRSISQNQLSERNWQDFAPFDLVVVCGQQILQCSWERDTMTIQSFATPFLLVSSSVDYEASTQVRRTAFDTFQQSFPHATAEQIVAILHRQAHADNPSLGFQMKRPGRRTRSISQAVVGAGMPTTRYLPLSQGQEPSR